MGILEDYKKLKAEEEAMTNENYDLPTNSPLNMTPEVKEAYIQELKKQRTAIADYDANPEYLDSKIKFNPEEFDFDERKVDDEDGNYPDADDPTELLANTNLVNNSAANDLIEKLNDPEFMRQQKEEMERRQKMIENPVLESELTCSITPVEPRLIRAFCPKCGKEIFNDAPVMFNPFSHQKVNMYKCECGFEANLEYAYPRVVFVDENNKEYNAYTK